MAKTHNLGFPRIGPQRELKFALESYWRGESDRDALEGTAQLLRRSSLLAHADIDFAPVGDFSLYDHVLDASALFGNLPPRTERPGDGPLDAYFRAARGRANSTDTAGIAAGEMTKWFDTNYHFIVPEFSSETRFQLDADRLLQQVREATELGLSPKPVILGPASYLSLGKTKDGSDPFQLLNGLLTAYEQLLAKLRQAGVEWLQLDEPILATSLSLSQKDALRKSYERLTSCGLKILLASYFGEVDDNVPLLCCLPVHGVHLDAVRGAADIPRVAAGLASTKILSVGIINGRNIWRTDMEKALDLLEPLHKTWGDRLWIAPSCSLLHVPVDLAPEKKLDPEVRSWLAFAAQKLDELRILGRALNEGRDAVRSELADSSAAIESRDRSERVHRPEVNAAVEQLAETDARRASDFKARSKKQHALLGLPAFPTTTIGSFPQTAEIRRARRKYSKGELSADSYRQLMKAEIASCVGQQEALGLDVLVHGEAERNDMVEYFGQQLEGFAFTELGWVQSYGSRCVKPPVLFGDVTRPKAMTVPWAKYAQSLTSKPVKGMLTGPVTILNWSFVRDDQPRSLTCKQLALCLRDEVQELEAAGIGIIQIDEAALREGLPLRKSQWDAALAWAVECFLIASSGVRDETQIHTHMCYSEFNDILPSIAQMDADVITIETSRSDMELLDAFEKYQYPNAVGPGVYDIHSPNVPSRGQVMELMQKAAKSIPSSRLWVNPDCGLKTRSWAEVSPALENMVAAAKTLRAAQRAPHSAG